MKTNSENIQEQIGLKFKTFVSNEQNDLMVSLVCMMDEFELSIIIC